MQNTLITMTKLHNLFKKAKKELYSNWKEILKEGNLAQVEQELQLELQDFHD